MLGKPWAPEHVHIICLDLSYIHSVSGVTELGLILCAAPSTYVTLSKSLNLSFLIFGM